MVEGARSYGFQVYVGRVLSIGTYNMDVLMVAALNNSREVAYYTLAGALTMPVMFLPLGIAGSRFPTMVREQRIRRGWLVAAWATGLLGAVATVLIGRPLIPIVLTSRYLPVEGLLVPLALASAVRGVTAVYNSFLTAHGSGRGLRDAAIVLTGSNLALNFALIPPFAALGAAWASLLALLANFGAHVVVYRRSVRRHPVDGARIPGDTYPTEMVDNGA
jgi:O-antigen/teichoic acid export membrane protein